MRYHRQTFCRACRQSVAATPHRAPTGFISDWCGGPPVKDPELTRVLIAALSGPCAICAGRGWMVTPLTSGSVTIAIIHTCDACPVQKVVGDYDVAALWEAQTEAATRLLGENLEES